MQCRHQLIDIVVSKRILQAFSQLGSEAGKIKTMKAYLAIETTTDICTVALSQGAEIAAGYHLSARAHAENILSLIDEIMSKHPAISSHLEAIVVGSGPGSFTGVRLGLSVAQGLAYGLNLPLIPVSSLAVIAQAAYLSFSYSQPITVAVKARQGECYWGVFSVDQAGIAHGVGEIQLLSVADLDHLSPAGGRIGNAWEIKDLEQDHSVISIEALKSYYPKALMLQGREVFSQGGVIQASALKANYVLDSLFTLKKQDL